MEDFRYEQCEIKNYYSLFSLSEQLVILQSLKHLEKNEKGYKNLCQKCGMNYKRIFKELPAVICSSCYDVKNEDYGLCISCNCDAKLVNNRCFICNEIEDVKHGIRDFIEIENNEILCKGCLCEKKSTEIRNISENEKDYLCKYCEQTNNRLCINMSFQNIEVDLNYEDCIIKFYNSIILLSKQLLMLHYMKKKIRKQIGYKTYCDKCGKNSIRVSEIKETYLCSSCEKKEDKDNGKCECCNCEGKLHNSKCFICIDIKEANKGMLDFIDIDDNSVICRDCNIEKKSTEKLKIINEDNSYYLNLCEYCYSYRIHC